MKQLVAAVMSLSLLAWACAHANQTITIARSGSQPSRQGPAENFTGSVRIEPLFNANEPSRASGALVTFEPAARTAWHTHPLGQTLIVRLGPAGFSHGVVKSRKSAKVMSSGSRRVRNTGTARRQPAA
jgi:4-carboxymuconolactone decarboxylase